MALSRYLQEEVALDFAGGQLSRREALHRLGLLGLSATSAGALLVAFAAGAEAADTAEAEGEAQEGRQHDVDDDHDCSRHRCDAQAITFTGPNGELQGAWAAAPKPKGTVLVIHENRGLTDHIKTIPPRFAADGYSALAVDLLSEEGGTATLGGDAQAIAALGQAPVERLVADMRAGIDELDAAGSAASKIGIIGFCFGGGMTWQLLAAGEPRLAAAAPFYGPAPATPDFTQSRPRCSRCTPRTTRA